MSFLPAELLPISSEEQLKIESFYKSFGTSLYTANTAACLYTMTNLKVDSLNTFVSPSTSSLSSMNRASIALSTGNTSTIVKNLNKPIINNHRLPEINHSILKDFMLNRYQNHVSVYHRGVPLWLFNSGKNPRRPNQQLKFTLAEKGTGFILWQDRIDTNSDYRIYGMRKSDKKIINFNAYCSAKLINDNDSNLRENKFHKVNELFTAMLITFRASDRKTTVFVKFDLNNEAASFYEYYLNINQVKQIEMKQRTKSLPAGIGIQIVNKGFAGQINSGGDKNVVTKRMTLKMNEQKRQQYLKNRQSYYNNIANNNNGIKYRRISKNDISNPCDLKHIININHSDRDSYYTLSKLLPTTVYSSSISTSNSYNSSYSSSSPTNDLSCLSSSSNSNSSTSISLSSNNNSNNNNNNNSEISNEPKRHSTSNCKSKPEQIEQLSSLSSVSLSLSPPFKLIGNQLIDINFRKQIRNF